MFEARQASGLKSFAVARGEAILTAALPASVNLSHISSRSISRACRGSVAQGELKRDLFRPTALSHRDRSAGYVLPCCARALGDVVVNAIEVDRPLKLTSPNTRAGSSVDRAKWEPAITSPRVPPVRRRAIRQSTRR
jgi:ferredoxin